MSEDGGGGEEEEDGEGGSLKPRPVMGSVGDSWIVRAFGREVREVEEERDWSRCL